MIHHVRRLLASAAVITAALVGLLAFPMHPYPTANASVIPAAQTVQAAGHHSTRITRPEKAITTGATFTLGVDGWQQVYGTQLRLPRRDVSCPAMLKRYGDVFRQMGLRFGMTRLPGPIPAGGPERWARTVHPVDPLLARALRRIDGRKSAGQAIMALYAAASAAVEGRTCI